MTQQAPSETATALGRAGKISFINMAKVDRVTQTSRPITRAAPLSDEAEEAVQLDQHLLSYEGCSLDKERYLWGLYGTSGQRDSRARAYADATRSKMLLLEIEGQYKLTAFKSVRAGLDREAVLETGYLHADRLNAAFREEMKSHLLRIASRQRTDFATSKHAKLSLGDLLLEHPWLLREIFDMDDRILMVVHRVRPVWNPGSRLGVQVCTMRRIAERIVGMKVSYRPELLVRC